MSMYSEQEARALLEKVLSYSQADECQCSISGATEGNIRYARNTVSTAGEVTDVTLAVESAFGKSTGVATINEFDDASLEKVVRRSEELARLSPENPEHMPMLGPSDYEPVNAWSEATAAITPEDRAQAAADSIMPSKENKLVSAGFLNDARRFMAMMNSAGMFAYHRNTNVNFTVTVRTEDGRGSGWVTRDFNDMSKLDTASASAVAIQKASRSVDTREMEPGKYTVILEPAASVTMLGNLAGAMSQRAADEGRSFMSMKPAEGETLAEDAPRNRIGEKMFGDQVTLWSDPQHPEVPTATFSGDGAPVGKTLWIDKGVVKTLPNSRYWAEKTGVAYVPTASSGGGMWGGGVQLIMQGGDASLEAMIRDTRRGILVTRLWYIRQLDPQTQLYTGLTRDGTFYIENGEIRYPIKNFRFNESPIVMLNNIEQLGRPVRINGSMIPPMKIRDFTFSSLSDAV
jgi:predicted Zn-dependent protease